MADGDLLRHYQYTYDLAGNRKSQSEALNGGAPVVTNYTYNAANQIMSDGTHTLTYDPNGNLTGDGVNSYAWDQANRLLSTGGIAYQYDGLGNRIQQTVDTTVTRYLLDLQPGLAVALRAHEWNETDPQNPVLEKTTHYIHSLRGIHAQQDNAGNWNWMVPDGLGSVRGVANDAVTTLESRSYAPYGEPFGVTMVEDYESPVYGFTGEPLDDNGLLYLRARYYTPGLGVFTGLDPFEGMAGRPMSLNGYSWVEGNPVMGVDPSGYYPKRGSARYSCTCGWLDIGHIAGQGAGWASIFRNVVSETTMQAVRQATGNPNAKGRVYSLPRVSWADTNLWFYIPENILTSPSAMEGIALGMWMEYHMVYETVQSYLDPLADIANLGSGFSEEDLPSNMIGYYLNTIESINDWSEETILTSPKFRSLCDIKDQPESDLIHDFYVLYLGGFSRDWRQWEKRSLPELDERLHDRVARSWSPAHLPSCFSTQWPAEVKDLEFRGIPKAGDIGIWDLAHPNALPSNGWYRISGGISQPNLGIPGVRGIVDTSDQINTILSAFYGVEPLVATTVSGVYGLKDRC